MTGLFLSIGAGQAGLRVPLKPSSRALLRKGRISLC